MIGTALSGVTFISVPGAVGLSPLSPLGLAPVPMVPGREVFGTPGWFMTLVLRPVEGAGVTTDGAEGIGANTRR